MLADFYFPAHSFTAIRTFFIERMAFNPPYQKNANYNKNRRVEDGVNSSFSDARN
jgi:hypothetical protein